jgi:hypothetical protein
VVLEQQVKEMLEELHGINQVLEALVEVVVLVQ